MLIKMAATNNQGATIEFPLGDIADGFLLKDVDGLDPVKATIVTSSYAQLDGKQYQASRRESRNIVSKIKLKPNPLTGTVRDLRNQLYSYFMPKSEVTLRFFDEDLPEVIISGMIDTFDCPLFVKDPEATISIECFLPDFYDPDPVTVSGSTTSDTSEFLINYDGTVETGIQLHLDINRTMSGFTVYHRPADNTLRSLEFAAPLSAGDTLDISTVSGAKGATLTRAGSDSSLLYGVSPYSNWINLFPGPNYIRVYAEGAAVPYSIEYTTKYGGL